MTLVFLWACSLHFDFISWDKVLMRLGKLSVLPNITLTYFLHYMQCHQLTTILTTAAPLKAFRQLTLQCFGVVVHTRTRTLVSQKNKKCFRGDCSLDGKLRLALGICAIIVSSKLYYFVMHLKCFPKAAFVTFSRNSYVYCNNWWQYSSLN